MASVESLSNSELRTKLAEYGAPVGPVTETTRKVLVKKLKHLMVQKDSSANEVNSNKSRKSLSRFSSGEDDSEDDLKTTHKSSKMPPPNSNYRSTRRQTIGIPQVNEMVTSVNKSRRSMQVTPTPPKPPIIEPEKKSGGRYSSPVSISTNRPRGSPSNIAVSTNNVTTRRGSQRSTPSLAEDYDDGSDSDASFSKIRRPSGSRDAKTVTADKDVLSSLAGTSSFLSRLSSVRATYLSDQNGGDEYAESPSSVNDLLSFRKRYTMPASNETPPQSPDSSSPYQSSFARRLSLAHARKPGSSLTENSSRTLELLKFRDANIGRDDSINSVTSSVTSRENGHFFSGQSEPSTSFAPKRSHDISEEFKTTEDDVAFWKNSQIVSMILLAFAFVFFLGLAVVYMNVRSKDSTSFFSEHERNIFPLCVPGADDHQPCIKNEDLAPAIDVMRELHPRLLERSILAQCGPPLHDGTYINPIMSEKDAMNLLSDKLGTMTPELKKSLHNLKLILLKNPHWGVTITSPYQHSRGAGKEQVEDIKVLIEHGGLLANNAVLPLNCWLKQMALMALTSLIIIGMGFVAVFAGQKGVMWFIRKREKEKQDVYVLVQRILELLQAHHHNMGSPGGGGTSQSFLAINHVRDQLIAPQDRNRMAALWEKAVTFLEHNESRVRHEVQHVAGEECPVWRWLPPSFANLSPTSQTSQHSPLPNSDLEPFNPNRNKVWQGQAFETDAGSPNSLPCSPTPCLKLRHMFDLDSEYGDDWPVKVQDAILEKCDGVKVLHIAVDKTSNEGCVYVKCTSQEEAGRAYRALHGWWFDSKLVTVKYIRLERYHERFPDAKNAKVSLKPSNNKKLSLQANFWQSPLEAN